MRKKIKKITGTKRFEYKDEKSNKFWEITVNGCEHIVRFGKVGTDGQKKAKSFDSDFAALEDAYKLINQKTKKGYKEVSDVNSESESVETKFRVLIGGLCKTDADNKILDELCAALVDMDDSVITFKEELSCNYIKGGEVIYNDTIPKSFSEISGCVKELVWDGGGPEVGFTISSDGSSPADEWLLDEIEDDSLEEAGEVIASFQAGQNGLFFDPSSKLSNGEPGMAFISHEEVVWEPVLSVQNCDYGQILLRMLSDAMLGTDYIPEIYF
jgi:predicted DNA-binding WGR domain protein